MSDDIATGKERQVVSVDAGHDDVLVRNVNVPQVVLFGPALWVVAAISVVIVVVGVVAKRPVVWATSAIVAVVCVATKILCWNL